MLKKVLYAILALAVTAAFTWWMWPLVMPLITTTTVVKTLLVLLIPVLAFLLILVLASKGDYFMEPIQGTTTFFVKGGTLEEIIPNIEGHTLSEKTDPDGYRWIIPESSEEKIVNDLFRNAMKGTVWFQKWLWRTLGVRFISLLYPAIRVHSFDLREGGRRRLVSRNELASQDAPLRARVVDSPESTVVQDLLFMVPRPIYVEGLELSGDNSKVNLLLLVVFQQVIPSLPVFNLRGDFFTALDASVEAVLVDFFARHKVAVYKAGKKSGQFAGDVYNPENAGEKESNLTYELWLKMTKAGAKSPIEIALRNVNFSEEYLSNLKEYTGPDDPIYKHAQALVRPSDNEEPGSDDTPSSHTQGLIPRGITPRFGFAVVSFRIVDWEPHESTRALAASLLAKETQRHAAEGVREEAYGQRDAKVANATGDSARVRQMTEALIEQGVSKDEAARVVETILRTDNLSRTKLTTYVEGGRRASVMVPASQPEKPEGGDA